MKPEMSIALEEELKSDIIDRKTSVSTNKTKTG